MKKRSTVLNPKLPNNKNTTKKEKVTNCELCDKSFSL